MVTGTLAPPLGCSVLPLMYLCPRSGVCLYILFNKHGHLGGPAQPSPSLVLFPSIPVPQPLLSPPQPPWTPSRSSHLSADPSQALALALASPFPRRVLPDPCFSPDRRSWTPDPEEPFSAPHRPSPALFPRALVTVRLRVVRLCSLSYYLPPPGTQAPLEPCWPRPWGAGEGRSGLRLLGRRPPG